MEDWKIRLIDEHIALKERVSKLTNLKALEERIKKHCH